MDHNFQSKNHGPSKNFHIVFLFRKTIGNHRSSFSKDLPTLCYSITWVYLRKSGRFGYEELHIGLIFLDHCWLKLTLWLFILTCKKIHILKRKEEWGRAQKRIEKLSEREKGIKKKSKCRSTERQFIRKRV